MSLVSCTLSAISLRYNVVWASEIMSIVIRELQIEAQCMTNAMAYNLVKSGGFTSNRLARLQWIVHSYLLSARPYERHRDVLSIWPWKSPSRSQIVNAKITKTHNVRKSKKVRFSRPFCVKCSTGRKTSNTTISNHGSLGCCHSQATAGRAIDI